MGFRFRNVTKCSQVWKLKVKNASFPVWQCEIWFFLCVTFCCNLCSSLDTEWRPSWWGSRRQLGPTTWKGNCLLFRIYPATKEETFQCLQFLFRQDKKLFDWWLSNNIIIPTSYITPKPALPLHASNITKGTTDPKSWVQLTTVTCLGHITSSNTTLDQISSLEYRSSINFKISTKHQHLD